MWVGVQNMVWDYGKDVRRHVRLGNLFVARSRVLGNTYVVY